MKAQFAAGKVTPPSSFWLGQPLETNIGPQVLHPKNPWIEAGHPYDGCQPVSHPLANLAVLALFRQGIAEFNATRALGQVQRHGIRLAKILAPVALPFMKLKTATKPPNVHHPVMRLALDDANCLSRKSPAVKNGRQPPSTVHAKPRPHKQRRLRSPVVLEPYESPPNSSSESWAEANVQDQ